jgi:hypothetical protein
MSTPVTTDGHLLDGPNFCKACGAPLAGGRFCPECGHAIAGPDDATDARADLDDVTYADFETDATSTDEAPTEVHSARQSAAAPEPATPVAQMSESAPKRGKNVGLIAGLIAGVIVIAAGVAAALLLTASDEKSADTVYREKVAAAFGPVLGANRQVSDTLPRLRGTKVRSAGRTNAIVAVRQAQKATTLATGAITALDVPAGSEQLARDTRQALDRESAYYADVARILARPTTASTGGVQELAANLTSALSVAGPTVAGTQPTVGGTARVVSWARGVRKAHAKSAAKRRKNNTGGNAAAPASQPAATTSAPASRGTSCGGGLFAGPNTSCEFAGNVRRAWGEAPGATNTVRVFSPVTGQTYTMNCAPSGDGVTCSGGNNASVSF